MHVGDNGFFCINSWRIKIALESFFEECAQETWERNLRKTTLLNTCNPILMEMILKVLREQSKDDDQGKTAGEIEGLKPETSLEWEENTEVIDEPGISAIAFD